MSRQKWAYKRNPFKCQVCSSMLLSEAQAHTDRLRSRPARNRSSTRSGACRMARWWSWSSTRSGRTSGAARTRGKCYRRRLAEGQTLMQQTVKIIVKRINSRIRTVVNNLLRRRWVRQISITTLLNRLSRHSKTKRKRERRERRIKLMRRQPSRIRSQMIKMGTVRRIPRMVVGSSII